MTDKSICFVGMDNYPVLAKLDSQDYVGGESVQQTLLARAFARCGYRVCMIVKDHGQPDDETIDGIRVIKGFSDRGGLPVVRFIHPRATGLLTALKRADCTTYFQSCAGAATGIVAFYCGRADRRFVFRLAHDSDCVPGQQLIRFWRDRKIYEFGLKRAGLISAQGAAQVALLQQHYGLASVPVNMAVEPPQASASSKEFDVLWVNNMRPFKRPDLAVELARMLPDYRFAMVGGPVSGHEVLFDEVSAAAAKVDNLDFIGAVPYSRVNAYFDRARVFANTSDQEGFPNSFLQAWIRGVPVISFFDPDSLIQTERLGAVPDSLADMATAIDQLLRSEEQLATNSSRCRDFAITHYSADAVARQYEKLIGALGA